MDNIGSLRRALMILVCLMLLKLVEYLITAPELDALASAPTMYMKLPRVQTPRCDACRAVAGVFDVAFREADSKIEHLGLELSLDEVNQIVKNVCTRKTFKYLLYCPRNRISLFAVGLQSWWSTMDIFDLHFPISRPGKVWMEDLLCFTIMMMSSGMSGWRNIASTWLIWYFIYRLFLFL